MDIHPATIKLMRAIFDRLFDNSETQEEYFIYCGLRDIMEHVLANDREELEEIYKKLRKK